ncbi:DUF2490 domain-containing protein [Dyadobacter psychrotolerans]|uniref:DUF2490 domain-containing protein n=1 Tax=Dyadobacter psychrotolerans TaxID=2541721 RepID=A0A4R5DSE7_9BACT|nr:DUF2490 domain-containing protein [Dyadobacter psychrotolerans]TDE17396.1 DUF2490 domain-containing protein [Dyadobacter psychrotolerans]
MKKPCLLFIFYLFPFAIFGQDVQYNGWLFWSHQQKLKKQWQINSDLQVRSAGQAKFVSNLLARAGLGYKLSDKQTILLGYTYFGSWEKENGELLYEPENRIYQQYQLENKFTKIEITNRLRYEQRFINTADQNVFAQRFRHYIQIQIPLISDAEFKKGLYTSIQNEIFLNVQGKNKINHHLYDQNRVYLGLGYRLSEKIEMESGYLFRYQIQEDQNVRNNILQLLLRTSY